MKNFLGSLVSVACQVTVPIAIPCPVIIHRQACGRQDDGWYGIIRLGLFEKYVCTLQVPISSSQPLDISHVSSQFPGGDKAGFPGPMHMRESGCNEHYHLALV